MSLRHKSGVNGEYLRKSRIDESEEWDDIVEERRVTEDSYIGQEEPSWILDSGDFTNKACNRLVKGGWDWYPGLLATSRDCIIECFFGEKTLLR